MTDGLNGTSYAKALQDVMIDKVILKANEKARIFEAVCYLRDAAGGPNKFRVNREDSPTIPAGYKTEAADGTATAFSLNAAEIDCGVIYARSYLSDELEADAAVTVQDTVARHLTSLSKRIDSDALGAITSATNTKSHAGNAATMARFMEAKGVFVAQDPVLGMADALNPASMLACVLHPKVWNDIQTDCLNTVGAVPVLGKSLEAFDKLAGSSYLGPFLGMHIFIGNVPQYDADNWSSAFLVAGGGGALTMPVKYMYRPEAIRVPKATSTEVVSSSRLGIGISNQGNLLEWVTAKA